MKCNQIKRQQGVALVVSLIILVSLTLLGLTAIKRTTIDLSMAGNQREIGLMFQAAEVGLVSAEIYIGDQTTNNVFSATGATDLGLYQVLADNTNYTSPDYFDYNVWENNSTEATTDMTLEHLELEKPRFMIEYLGDREQNPAASINIGGGYGGVPTGDIVSIYRSTARGVGLTGNSFRYVQSYFGKDKP